MTSMYWVYLIVGLLSLVTLGYAIVQNQTFKQCQVIQCKEGPEGATKVGEQGKTCTLDSRDPNDPKCMYHDNPPENHPYALYASVFYLSLLCSTIVNPLIVLIIGAILWFWLIS